MKAKIVIVGGGASGTSLALHAAKRCDPLREPVVLIEKERLGAGASGRASAIVHQGYGERVMAGMARDAVKVYTGMQSTTGRSVGYRRTGVLFLAGASDEARARLERDGRMQRDLAIDVRTVGAEEMRRIVPGIQVGDQATGAWQPEGGFVDPHRTIDTFATLARDKGAITRIGIKDPRVLVEGGHAVGVATSAGVFHAPNVVLATGPWTPGILAELGVQLPLRTVKVQELFLEMPRPEMSEEEELDSDGSPSEFETRFIPDPLERLPVAHPVLVDLESGFHARCEPARQRTRVGKTGFDGLEELECPEALDDEVDPDFSRWIREALAGRMPVYRDQEQVGAHTAWMTLTPDGRPVLGPIEAIPGLFLVAGFSGNDFQLSPSIGEGLAQMILEQPVSAFDPEFFSPARFG